MVLARCAATLPTRRGYQAPMPFPKLSTVLLGCLLAAVFAAPASAYSPFQLGIHDLGAAGGDLGRYDAIRDSNANLGRYALHWARMVPGGTEKPAGFDTRNPADPHYDWSLADNWVKVMAARGVQPFITTLEAPPWAEGDDAADRANRIGQDPGAYRPNAKEYGDFMHAVATRYSGSFKDANGNTLPRVRYFQMWNEPNFGQYLVSQKKEDIPGLYVKLLNAGYDAVRGVSKSNTVVGAGFGPFGNNQRGTDVDPQVFMRAVLCLSGKGGEHLRDKKRCGGVAKPKFDVWAQQPYSFGGTPTSTAGSPDGATIGNMADIKRTLDFAVRARNVSPSGRKKLWVSEFAWIANPPGWVTGDGTQIGISPARQAAYLSESAYRLWKLGFEAMVWFGLDDQSVFPTGLYKGAWPDVTPRPALDAFKFPFFADATSRGVLFWGLVNRGGRTTVRIERQVGSNFKRVADVRTDSRGMFYTRLRGKKATYRATALNGQKSGLTSQAFRSR